MDATTTENGTGATAQPAATTSSGGSAAKKNEPKLPTELNTGKYTFIKELCESQRPNLGKVMADQAIAMFKMRQEIIGRVETLAHFNTTYVDKHDMDADGNGKVKPFIPSSLRKKQPLNFSKKVKDDSRCAASLTAIMTVMEEAHTLHELFLD